MAENETTGYLKPRQSRGLGRIILFALTSIVAGAPVAAQGASANQVNAAPDLFVRRAGPHLKLKGNEFRFAGTNNYYLPYKSQFMVNDVLVTAAGQGFTVLRTWGAIDIGNQDGSNSLRGKPDGVYFQYWGGTAPAYNDGDDGLKHLDYVIQRAGQLGLRLVIPLVNNWGDFGGMDQYVAWRGGSYHDSFYTDATIRGWYQAWISHVLNHKNVYTGVAYKDDPTIMTWELGNEPRCQGSGAFPTSSACTTATITAWADEMSRFIAKNDKQHLVSVGDEGFYCTASSTDWTENCGEGVDAIALARLPKIDVVSYHLYPDGWGKTAAWGQDWIERHVADALANGKPAVMGEFGYLDQKTRNAVYKTWTDTVLDVGGAGALVWMSAGKQDDGTLYPDYDGFTVYASSPVATMLSHFSSEMSAGAPLAFPPVADHDSITTAMGVAVTLHPLANDVAYRPATLVTSAIDLDPSTPGQQTTAAVAGGVFVANPDGTVVFTPAAGFVGNAQVSYVVGDTAGRSSNVATLTVTVEGGSQLLASFETGTEGWGPASWDPGAATDQQTTAFHTLGSYGLEIDPAYGEWFGLVYNTPVNLSTATHLKVDIQTTSSGTSSELAIQVGSSWTWCQAGGWGWVNGSTTTTMDFDLSTLDCGVTDLSQVHALYLFLGNGGPGAIYIDNVRAK